MVHPDLEALLALQEEDAAIHEMEERLRATQPRLQQLDRAKESAETAVTRSQASLEAEEKKQRELQMRVAEHRTMHEKNVAQLDQVKKMREATAAVLQVERARRILADEEGELVTINRRIVELREACTNRQADLVKIDADQTSSREEIDAECAAIEEQLAGVRGKRNAAASKVPRPLLAKYDRIRTRRPAKSVFLLRETSCGNCDTSVPLQRRNLMLSTGIIEVCEACGVLLYAAK